MKKLLGIALLTALSAAGCKQGLGERCQVTADCKDPLVCNQATMTCANGTSSDLDADIPDGPKIDAAVDGATDAPRDAPHD